MKSSKVNQIHMLNVAECMVYECSNIVLFSKVESRIVSVMFTMYH